MALLSLADDARGQTTSTTIQGAVVDSSGAVLAGAKVTALNTRTGISRETHASSTGDYTFPLLDVGVYDVTAEAQGFRSETRRNVLLEINEKVRADFVLQIGGTQERVEVTAESATLRTDDATLGQTIEQRRVEELPLNNRSIGALAILQPGVQYGPRSGTDGQGFGQRQGGQGIPIPGIGLSFVANGQRETNQHATLDGVVATEARVNTVTFNPSPEAVAEFKVLSGSYSAEYGFNAGAQTIIVTKSGGNDYHGSLFEFLRNDRFDAENFFQNYFTPPGAPQSPKDSLEQNNFGGVLSGPLSIPKLYDGQNKTFFMVNYEGRRRSQGRLAQTANHPPEAFRRGDFSSLLALPTPIVIADPLSADPCNLANRLGCFPGNMIPDSRIASSAKELMQFWPVPQTNNANPLVGVNYTGFETRDLDDDQTFVRIDHNVGQNDRIFGRYAFDDVTYTVVPGDNPNFTYYVAGRTQNVGIAWIHMFSSNLINEARYGYNRSVDNTLEPARQHRLQRAGAGPRRLHRRQRQQPAVHAARDRRADDQREQLLDAGRAGRRQRLRLQQPEPDQRQHHVGARLAHHEVRLRLSLAVALPRRRQRAARRPELQRRRRQQRLRGVPAGAALEHGDAGRAAVDRDAAEPLRAVCDGRLEGDAEADASTTACAGSTTRPAVDIDGLWRSLSFTELTGGLPTLIPTIGTEFEFYEAQKTLFMPRLGIAYRPTDDWVVRSGFGIYYNVHQLNNYTILNLNPPKSGTSTFTNTSSGGKITNSPSQPVLTYSAPFGVVNPSSATGINALSPDNNQPYVTQWSLDAQRRLPWDFVLSVGYVGNKGTHIDQTVELNAPPPAVGGNANARRPIQQFSDGPSGPVRPLNRLRWLTSDGNSWYHALQVNAQRRFSKGFLVNVAYTYSKAMGEGYGRNEGGGTLPNSYQNPNDRGAEKTRYGFDVRHNAVINFLYEIPLVRGLEDSWARHILDDWQANGIIQLRTGVPFTVTQNNTINTIEGHVRPDRLSDGALENRTIDKWFDPDAFQVVTCAQPGAATPGGAALNQYLTQFCHYGDAGQGILEGPGFKNVDFSLMKNIAINNGMRLQFRWEIFNLFNTPQFGVPNSGLNASPAFLPSVAGGAFPTQVTPSRGPGSISTLVAPMRQMQFGLKLLF